MPELLARMAKFTETYDPEGLPEETIELVRSWFTYGDMRLGVWVIIDNDEQIVAHLFVTPEPLGLDPKYFRFALVRQALVNPGVDAREETKVVFEQACMWARSLDLKTMLMFTHRSAESMARKWGFVENKKLMRRLLLNERGE